MKQPRFSAETAEPKDAKQMKISGKIAYDAYCDSRQWKSFDGKALPKWPEVKLDIQLAWDAAANAVWNFYYSKP